MELVLKRLVGENIDLKMAGESKLGRVRADQGQMEQVLLNLVAKAREAMPTGGTLNLQTANVDLDEEFVRQHAGARRGPHVMLAVSDSGAGLEAESRDHLFEPGEGFGRSGLGLAAVYGVVKQSGGYIAVDSEPGRGTTFRVYLPRVAERSQEEKTSRVANDDLETVLVVEDEGSLLKLAREFLESSGYRVLAARDGAEALEVSDQHAGPIHLVVTDVVMPRMNGWELAKHLAIRRPEAKVLYVSGYADDAVVRQGLLDPEVSFLRKPFTLETLARKLREVLANESRPPETS
jgi:CheY-like chemotaxis protein